MMMRLSKCKRCGRRIGWIRTTKGKPMPVEPYPLPYIESPAGTHRAVLLDGRVVSCEFLEDDAAAQGFGYKPHWAYCSDFDPAINTHVKGADKIARKKDIQQQHGLRKEIKNGDGTAGGEPIQLRLDKA
ncbi:MAG: hypothetical protein ACK5JF_08240 [Oscillospiraceae bacterium]